MSKGTILYIGGFELPDKNAAAHRVLNNGKIFRNLDYDVLFLGVDKVIKEDTDILTTYKNVQGFDCWTSPYPKKNTEWIKYLSSIKYTKKIIQSNKNVQIIVAYNYPAIGLFFLIKYGKKNNIKIISDCTEWYSTKDSNLVFKIIKGIDSFLRMRIIQKHLDGIIVISKYLERYYENCKNVICVPPLVDINEDKWKLELSKKTNVNSKNKIFRFVYSGSPGRNKDKINYIIDAFFELKNARPFIMDIIGISRSDYLSYYPSYSEKLSVMGESIKFSGRVSHLESINCLKDADFSIFIREKSRLTMAGFPTKFVESVACSTPVITTNASDINEYFKNGEYGYIIQDSSVSSLLKVLEEILSEDIETNNIKQKINRFTFHYEQYTEKFKYLLENI